jgi:hypothetical protein
MQNWYRKGVRIVNDLIKENGEFYSFEEFEKSIIFIQTFLNTTNSSIEYCLQKKLVSDNG